MRNNKQQLHTNQMNVNNPLTPPLAGLDQISGLKLY